MTIDDTKQYRKISRILNPGPIETVSEHVYQHGRQFADLGKVSLDEQIAIAVETGKVYVMGEFGAIRGSREDTFRSSKRSSKPESNSPCFGISRCEATSSKAARRPNAALTFLN